MLIKNKKLIEKSDLEDLSSGYKTITYIVIVVVWILGFYLIYFLGKFWIADRNYALGYNLDRVGQYQDAYPKLLSASNAVPSEPTFKDELSYASAILAVAYFNQGDQDTARTLMNQSLTLSNDLINSHPNNIVILKNRVRTLTELSKIDPQYYGLALQTIVAAQQFAPNDAKIAYNTGVILGQTGQVAQGIQVLERAVMLRPIFRDAYFALGLFYRDMATESSNTVKHEDLEKKAEDNLNYILKNINADDDQVKETLASWGVL